MIDENIAILTIYTPQEALYYFLHEWEKNPDTATVIKRIKYDKPPVVKLKPLPTKATLKNFGKKIDGKEVNITYV